MARRSRPNRFEKELEALRPALADPDSPASHAILRTALNRSGSFVAAKAAVAVREHLPGGFEEDLKAAFERFMKDSVKTDPGCKAKLAALEALDYLESLDPAPFLTALRYFQPEPGWGSEVDTAWGLRARGALGLARQGHVDFLLLMADLLVDPEAPVREAAADAIAHRGNPAGAGLLQLKLRVGDPQPLVILACMSGLISLVPDWGVATVTAHLHDKNEELCEVAALALGQSRREEALDELLSTLSSEVSPRRRSMLLRALGLHRSDRALEAVLQVVATGSRADAMLAVESLAARSLESGLMERVREAAARNAKVDLTEALRGVFTERG